MAKLKQKQMTVSYPHFNRSSAEPSNWYKVEKMSDSIEYHPGDLLKKSIVESLCHSDEWKVAIVPVK